MVTPDEPVLAKAMVVAPSARQSATRRRQATSSCRRLLSARSIERDRGADERLQRIRVDLLTLVNVDGAPDVAVQARVEELRRIFQGCALEEGQLHDRLVRLSGADAPVVGPH